MAADYSKTPLVKKLGVKPYIQDPPDDYFIDILGPLPEGVVQCDMLLPNMDVIHIFTKERMLLEAAFETWKAHLAKTGMLWISWPKKAAKVLTNLASSNSNESFRYCASSC